MLDELATLLGRRTNFEFAARKLKQIYEADIQIERTDEKDELKALKFLEKYADQNISFTDCLSFVIMQRLKIKQVFSFDKWETT
ncbi:MAG: PIN domain-containing protein [Desulfobacteraceae bacterium]|nr:PIN domain-containing protein [Desulfobacteraceae bacterium]